MTARLWARDGAPPQLAPGARFITVHVHVRLGGLVATLRNPTTTLRLGMHEARTCQLAEGGAPLSYPRARL